LDEIKSDHVQIFNVMILPYGFPVLKHPICR
jgi:hypothetical protein